VGTFILSRYHQLSTQIDNAHKVARAIHQANLTPTNHDERHFIPNPADLRGIPVVGKGISGVSPGTHPETETIRRNRT
jgi:hypothetical protein